MKCSVCGKEIGEKIIHAEDIFAHKRDKSENIILCEDCYKKAGELLEELMKNSDMKDK